MKKSILTLCIALLPLLSFAQSQSLSDFENKYKDHNSAFSLTLPGSMLKLASVFSEDASDENIQEVIKSIDTMHIFRLAKDEQITGSALKGLQKSIAQENFADVMTTREKGATINILMREAGENIDQVIFLIESDKDLTILDISGKIDPEKVGLIAQQMNFGR